MPVTPQCPLSWLQQDIDALGHIVRTPNVSTSHGIVPAA